MTKRNSTRTSTESKPAKPERPEGSPLFWHPSGRWCKKIRGKQHYFGRGSHDDALADYEKRKADLHTGRTTRPEDEGLTIHMLCVKFLSMKKLKRDTGALSVHTFNDYAHVCKFLQKALGKNRMVDDLRADDFDRLRSKMPKTWGLVRVGNIIIRARVVFKYAAERRLISRPLDFGEVFKRPSKKDLRKHRQAQGPRMFTAEEVRAMLGKAKLPLRAMLLLAVQAGFGNSDVGNLPLTALDLEGGWIDFPRPKTAIMRRVPLWPETVQALRDWLKIRPEPVKDEHRGLVFLTARGDSWAKDTSDNPVSKETAKLLKACSINSHRNFYTLRHTFQSVGDDARDPAATSCLMGHADSSMAAAYREPMEEGKVHIADDRLRAVVQHVRVWLFGDGKAAKKPIKKTTLRVYKEAE